MAVVEFVHHFLSIPEDFRWLAMCTHISVSGPLKAGTQHLISPLGVRYTINSQLFEVVNDPQQRFIRWMP
jgi:hypothetical protein